MQPHLKIHKSTPKGTFSPSSLPTQHIRRGVCMVLRHHPQRKREKLEIMHSYLKPSMIISSTLPSHLSLEPKGKNGYCQANLRVCFRYTVHPFPCSPPRAHLDPSQQLSLHYLPSNSAQRGAPRPRKGRLPSPNSHPPLLPCTRPALVRPDLGPHWMHALQRQISVHHR